MTREIAYLDVINRIKKYLTNIATVEYGEISSMDELLKFKSMDEIPLLTLRKKQHYFDKCQYILKNFEKKDTVDYILTLSKLYTDENFKDRFFDMGIAEADMIGTAAGMAMWVKIPVASTFIK